jgi:hypothetical protein
VSLKKNLLAISILSVSLNANAALTNYTGAGGAGLVYSSISNITWTQDANLFKTLYDADNTLISQIASVTPTYNDSAFGLQTIDADDFNIGIGKMSWFGAKAFINYLNIISYGGSNEWHLQKSNNLYSSYAYAGNELPVLFYDELGGSVNSYIPNTGTFNNLPPDEADARYWSDLEYGDLPNAAWIFYISDGYFQSVSNKADGLSYAWAVSPGQVPTVPLPAASWFMLTGLFGLFGLKRFKKHSLVQ